MTEAAIIALAFCGMVVGVSWAVVWLLVALTRTLFGGDK